MDITLVSKTNFDAANAAIERDIYNIAIGASSKKQCDLSVSGTSFWRMPGDYLKSGSFYWISFTANQSFTADQVALCTSATKSSKVGVIASNVSFVAGKATRILYKAGQSVGRYILMLNNAAKFSAVSLYSTNTNNQISQKLSLIESYVTPQQFGAKGDGVTDDTQAIQKAIDSASAGYGVVLFRAQKYLIKTSASMYSANATSTQKIQWQSDATILKAKSNVMLVSGCHSKILTKGTKQYFCMIGDRGGGARINNFTVDGLSFSQQQEQLDGKPYNCALYFGKVNNLKIENCVIEYNGINGVYVNGHNNSHVTVSNNIICFNRVTVTEDGYEDYDSSGINVKSAQYVISNNYIGTKKTQANRMHGGIEAHGVCGNVYANSIQRVASGIYVCNDIRQTYAQNDDNDNCWGKDYSSTSSQQMVWDTDAYLQKSTIIISENRFADVDVVINVWNNVSSSGSSAIRYLPPDVNIDVLNNSGIACGTAFAITQDHNVRNVRFSGNHFRCRQMKITSTDISTGDLKRYAAVKCDSNCRIWDVSIDGNFFEGYASIIQWGHDKTGKQQQIITFTNNVMKDCLHYSSTIDVRSMSIYPYFFLFYFNGQGVQAYLDGNEIQIRDKYRVLNSDGTISEAYNDIVPGILYQNGKAKVMYGQHNRLLNASVMLCRKKLNGFIRQENTGYVSIPGGIQSGTRIVYNYDAQKWFDVGDKLVSVQDHSVKTCTRKGTNKSQTLANGTFMVTKFGFCFSTNDIDKIDIGDHIQIKWNNNADEKYVHQVLFKIGDRFYTSCINESKLRDRYQPGYTAQAQMNFYSPLFAQTVPCDTDQLNGFFNNVFETENVYPINLLDPTKIKRGYTLSRTTGLQSVSETMFASDFIEVTGGEDYCGLTTNASGLVQSASMSRFIAYNSDKSFNSQLGTISSSTTGVVKVTVPETAKYIRIAAQISQIDTYGFMICEYVESFPVSLTDFGKIIVHIKNSDYITESNAVDKLTGATLKAMKFAKTSDAVFGANLSPAIGTYTATNATWDGTKWVCTAGVTLSANVTIKKGAKYLVEADVSDPYTSEVPPYVTLALGDDSATIFAANDAYWKVVLEPTNDSGAVQFSFSGDDIWTGKVSGITIKEIVSYNTPVIVAGDLPVYADSDNQSVFGGKYIVGGTANVSVGKNSHQNSTTMRWCTSIGYNSQRKIQNGTGNTAIGYSAQRDMESGCYNNVIGNSAQTKITTGCWNNAMGNEAQGCLTTGNNNVAIGRRAQHALTTGSYNVAIGTWAGFTGINIKPDQPDNRNTITANRQTLVGAKARQNGQQSDDLTLIGYGTIGAEKSTAIGAEAHAKGSKSVAIGYGVQAVQDNQVRIGDGDNFVVLCGKRINFNSDGTVTWQDA